jgi:hypothetical protein
VRWAALGHSLPRRRSGVKTVGRVEAVRGVSVAGMSEGSSRVLHRHEAMRALESDVLAGVGRRAALVGVARDDLGGKQCGGKPCSRALWEI